MHPVKKRFYYDTQGFIFFDVNLYSETSIEKDIQDFKVLSERNRETFDVIELDYGAYAQDFAECIGYRVNPETKTLEFSYPDPNAPEEPQPFVKPLSEQVKTLENQQKQLNDDLLAFMDYVTTGGM